MKFPLVVKMVFIGAYLVSDLRAEDCQAQALSEIKMRQIQVESQISETNRALGGLEKTARSLGRKSAVRDIVKGVVTTISDFVPGVSTLKEWSKKLGLPLIVRIFKPSSKKALDHSKGMIFTFDGKSIFARDLTEARAIIDARLEELEALIDANGRPLINLKTAFPDPKRCIEHRECLTVSSDITEMTYALARWSKKARSAGLSASRRVMEVELPLVRYTLRTLKISQTYYRQLMSILNERMEVCQPSA